MSDVTIYTSPRTITLVGMAETTLGKTAFSLCRSYTRQDYLVLINAHFKWIEAFCTPTAYSAAVIEELRLDCKVWYTRDCGYRQWYIFREC